MQKWLAQAGFCEHARTVFALSSSPLLLMNLYHAYPLSVVSSDSISLVPQEVRGNLNFPSHRHYWDRAYIYNAYTVKVGLFTLCHSQSKSPQLRYAMIFIWFLINWPKRAQWVLFLAPFTPVFLDQLIKVASCTIIPHAWHIWMHISFFLLCVIHPKVQQAPLSPSSYEEKAESPTSGQISSSKGGIMGYFWIFWGTVGYLWVFLEIV